MRGNKLGITTKEYSSFDQAYDFYNQELFDNELPPCLITLQRKSKAMGYFHGGRFKARNGVGQTDEIALNPDNFTGFSDLEVLDTLVHEMCHLWQHHLGKPSRSGYHNREWAIKMEKIGLIPSSTGKPGGQKTGQNMSDYPIEGGKFLEVSSKLLKSGFKLNWESIPLDKKTTSTKNRSKTKYSCPICSQNAWAKPESNLICGHCMQRMISTEPTSSKQLTTLIELQHGQ